MFYIIYNNYNFLFSNEMYNLIRDGMILNSFFGFPQEWYKKLGEYQLAKLEITRFDLKSNNQMSKSFDEYEMS